MSWRTRHIRFLVTGLAISLCTSLQAAAQTRDSRMSDAAEELKSGKPPAALTLDTIMDAAVRNIAKRYNLNEAQRDLTDQLMKRGVERFLKDHENEVWPVIGDLLRSRLGLEPPDAADAMRIGKAARPLLEAAKEYIYSANEEWRTMLTDEQKTVHDFDLKDMKRQFAEMDENFKSWEEGEPNPRLFPTADKSRRQPPRPTITPDVQPEYRIFDPNLILETLVEEFIKEHKLSKGQVTAARSILEEFKGQANDYKMSKKKELAAVAIERHAALQARDLSGIKAAETKHKKLLKPIYALCDAMTDRLEKQLTTAQIQRHAGESDRGGEVSARPIARQDSTDQDE
ncbi:MAG: hypothetical protein IH989_03370 [Planctomycetes bacterium]|nr:hypothetical protein [Planctomycetota bacterium]